MAPPSTNGKGVGGGEVSADLFSADLSTTAELTLAAEQVHAALEQFLTEAVASEASSGPAADIFGSLNFTITAVVATPAVVPYAMPAPSPPPTPPGPPPALPPPSSTSGGAPAAAIAILIGLVLMLAALGGAAAIRRRRRVEEKEPRDANQEQVDADDEEQRRKAEKEKKRCEAEEDRHICTFSFVSAEKLLKSKGRTLPRFQELCKREGFLQKREINRGDAFNCKYQGEILCGVPQMD